MFCIRVKGTEENCGNFALLLFNMNVIVTIGINK